jgi:hypothetical protein
MRPVQGLKEGDWTTFWHDPSPFCGRGKTDFQINSHEFQKNYIIWNIFKNFARNSFVTMYPIVCADFAEHPCHSLQYESILQIDPGGHLWWTRVPKTNVLFLHTRMRPVQGLKEGDWTTFWHDPSPFCGRGKTA